MYLKYVLKYFYEFGTILPFFQMDCEQYFCLIIILLSKHMR